MELWIGAINLGFLYAFLATGVFITFRIHNFPDVTVDGSFVAGAAAAAVLIDNGVNPIAALLASFLVGAAAGCATAMIHTRFDVNGLLAGILVMTGLYSINLHIMGRSNIPLLDRPSFIRILDGINPGLQGELWLCLCLFAAMCVFWAAVSYFFRSDLGITMRATGNNPVMAAASGINFNRMKIYGIAGANGLVGVSGGLVAQYQGFADIGMGIGAIVFGLASVIIGESVLKVKSVSGRLAGAILGSVIFRLMVALALYVGLDPIDLKLVTAVFVLLILVAPRLFAGESLKSPKMKKLSSLMTANRIAVGFFALALILLIAFIGVERLKSHSVKPAKIARIGLVQLTDHPMLNTTRDSFLEEMKKIGYRQGENCDIQLENANGDLPTVNSILDKFLLEKVDVVVAISTACTQAAVNKIKDRPVVFATVANPFIIGAGKSDTDHLPNVTGVYGSAPMAEMMEMVVRILPGKYKIGCIWDSAQANSVFNVGKLKEALARYPDITFQGATITNSSEVFQAAQSLAGGGIAAFVLSPDNTVYSAFESVLKAAKTRKIPIFISDVERLKDGALCAYGYEYAISGIQGAHLVDRILKGEKPSEIPFEQYKKLSLGFNLKAAKENGITIPSDLLEKADNVLGADIRDLAEKSSPEKGGK